MHHRAGSKSDALTILLTGHARVIRTDSCGREVILAILRPGDDVGEMSLIGQEPHCASVLAEVQTGALALSRQECSHCLPDAGSEAHAMLKGLVQRLRHADRKIESLALMDVYGRLAAVLMEFAAEKHGSGQGCAVFARKVSRCDWARLVGASRDMVSRVMKDLEERDLIQTQYDGSLLVKPHLDFLV